MLSDAGCPGVADPGAALVAAAHAARLRVVPLVGPSSLLLALMASGMNGQSFAFHGYLPVKPGRARRGAARGSRRNRAPSRRAQLFIETPYRNEAMLQATGEALAPSTDGVRRRRPDAGDRNDRAAHGTRVGTRDLARFAKRPAIFILRGAGAIRGASWRARSRPASP